MKIIFSAVSLLVALAVIGLLAKQQLRAGTGSATPSMAAAASQAGVTLPPGMGGPKTIERRFQDAASQALQQGAARASEADQ